MWLLKKLNDGTTKYLISENKLYTVGRKNCDITLEEDASVSRKHCTFYVAKLNENSTYTLTKVSVVDEQSKYGTFLRSDNIWAQLRANERKNLSNGSIIKFGLLENTWKLEYKPIIACASGLPLEEKKNIETLLQSIDGFLKTSWCKECSLVIVNEITLTVKVVLALINGIPLVTPGYLEKVAESVKNQTELPNYENYQPAIKESILDKSCVSLDAKNNRRELFRGKKFIIPTRKQLEMLKDVITCAGGSIELFSSTLDWETFAKNDVVVIQLPLSSSGIPEDLIKSFKEITSFLKTNYGKRVVPESEIAQAVAYSSVEKFCNPRSTCFNFKIGERKQVDLGSLIVEETPTTSEEINVSHPGVVSASATCDCETPLHKNTQLQSSTTNSVEFQCPSEDLPVEGQLSCGNKQQESQTPLFHRKRTHNFEEVEQLKRNKKVRNPDNSSLETSEGARQLLVENKIAQDNPHEVAGKVTPSKAAGAGSIVEANSAQKPSEVSLEKIRGLKQSSSDFWKCELPNKRKISPENQDFGEYSNRKKAKLSNLESERKTPEVNSCEDIQMIRQTHKTSDSFPPPRKLGDVGEENDFTDYFGKETSGKFSGEVEDELSSTILSLAIIQPSFLKEDGSLLDPPDVPVNVKKFKKQKIRPVPILNLLEDDELSDGEWIEPHPGRVNISVVDEDEF